MSWVLLAGAIILLLVAGIVYVVLYLQWEQRQTSGMAYYGRSSHGRSALKNQIRWRSAAARPMVRLLAGLGGSGRPLPAFEFRGVSGPPRVSSPEIFERASAYQPRPEDVFVTTQMRCGTTWMQQIVYEVVCGGQGDLSDTGHGHLYAVSPWIDAANSVSMERAPLVGDRPSRIIKSHLPVAISPYNEAARFIYVTRHPVACFASIVDYYRTLLGPVMPPLPVLTDWYCSDRMYWSPWPDHVAGWWDWSASRPNVLFVHFEEMKRDLGGTIARVATFLGRPLSTDEHQRVVAKCTFEYMRDHEDVFEMAPPTMYSVAGGRFMAGGKAARHDDVTPEIRDRILRFCRERLTGRSYPASTFYSDLAG
jgi:hypothetical protein